MPMDLCERLTQSSEEAMRQALFSHLREGHAQVAAREELYKLIRQSDPEARAQSLASAKESLPDHLFRLIEEGLSEQTLNARIKAESRKLKPVAIEIPFQTYSESSTSPWTARIFIPTRHDPVESLKISLQNSIHGKVKGGIGNYASPSSAVAESIVGGFDSLVFQYPNIRGGLISKLKEPGVPEPLKLSLSYVEIPLFDLAPPQRAASAPTQPSPVRSITLTNGAVKYRLIPIRMDTEDFFPGYNVPFILVTGTGEFTLHRTSRREGSAQGGNYITGNLGNLYRSHQVVPGSQLVIKEIERHKRYFLDSVVHPLPR